MAEPAEDREIVACLQAGPEWTRFQQRAPEIADGISKLRIGLGRREVVFIAGVPFVDQPMQPLVAQSAAPVENRERAVGKKITDELCVLESSSTSGGRGDGTRGRERNHRAAGNDGRQDQRAFSFDQALSRKWARVPHLAGAGKSWNSLIDDVLRDLDHPCTSAPRRLGDS